MLPRGRIKSVPEDFVVEEIPLYEPSGNGEHLYVRFTKRNLTTDAAARAIASALGTSMRDVGIAGMKDKVGVTTQTISIAIPRGDSGIADRAGALSIDGITIHSAKRHGNKLRTGHLAGNRFTIVVRGIDESRLSEVRDSLLRVGREGLPNAFGAQRFGRDRDNASRARAWLSGREQGPRDPRMKRLLWSALQSELFNEVLRRRVEDGTWATPLLGDLLKLDGREDGRDGRGGLFLCTDVQTDFARALRGEVSPTGPIFGVKMRAPEGEPQALEQRVLGEMLGDGIDLAITKPLGEGSRRVLRLGIDDLRIDDLKLEESLNRTDARAERTAEQGSSIKVCFVLPKGAYATTVLGSAVSLEETTTARAASLETASPEASLEEGSPASEEEDA